MRVTADRSLCQQRRAAGALRRRGLGPGERLVLLLPGSTDFVSVALGALRTGVVPVPLDPRLTERELGRLLEDIEPSLVVDDPALLEELLDGPEAALAPYPL
ncbi:MAG: AMP-binding protein, partial [Nocardioidaceae bacterium]